MREGARALSRVTSRISGGPTVPQTCGEIRIAAQRPRVQPVATQIVRYGVVGSGFRASAFLRLAELLPERLVVSAVVTRDAARGAEIEARWGVPTVRDVADLARWERPDFVVTAVPAGANPGVVEDLVRLRMPVLSETPPAGDVVGMRQLWSAVGASGLVQVAEQYALQPMNAARLAILRAGAIGIPTSAQVSMTQLYHAVSLLRDARGGLRAGRGTRGGVYRAVGKSAFPRRLERRRHTC